MSVAGLGAVVWPVSASADAVRARRPADSSLRTVRATDEVRRYLRPWDAALKAYLAARSGAVGAHAT